MRCSVAVLEDAGALSMSSGSSLQTALMHEQPYASGGERAGLLESEAVGSDRRASTRPPADRYNSVYMIMFLQGMGMLFGWNMFITAVVYFQSRLEGSRWHDCVENYVTFAFQVCNVGVQLLLTAWPLDVVFPMLCVNTLVFAACLALVYVHISVDLFFALTIACAMMAGITCAGVSAGVYGIGGTLPPSHTQAVMSGQALGGVVVAVSSVLFGFLPPTPEGKQEAAAGYFIVAVVVLVACTATIVVLPSVPFMACVAVHYPQLDNWSIIHTCMHGHHQHRQTSQK